jgi:uncharacterized Zn finger protein
MKYSNVVKCTKCGKFSKANKQAQFYESKGWTIICNRHDCTLSIIRLPMEEIVKVHSTIMLYSNGSHIEIR